jgi:hypothetical protein
MSKDLVIGIVLFAFLLLIPDGSQGSDDEIDREPPKIVMDHSDENASTGGAFTFILEVSDDGGIGSTWLYYTYEHPWFGRHTGVQMMPHTVDDFGNGTYVTTITVATWAQRFWYFFSVLDTVGNGNWTSHTKVGIEDVLPPSLIVDHSDAFAYTGGIYHIRIRVSDNIEVDRAYVSNDNEMELSNYIPPGGGWPIDDMLMRVPPDGGDGWGSVWPYYTTGPEWEFSYNLSVPQDRRDPIEYNLTVIDVNGNVLRTANRAIPVVDDDPPMVEAIVPMHRGAVKGLDFEVEVRVTDNWGVTFIEVEYWTGRGSHSRLTVDRNEGGVWSDHTAAINISTYRWATGQLHIIFHARDKAVNWATSRTVTVPLGNHPPIMEGPAVWIVKEGDRSVLDLRQYIVDDNDHSSRMLITCYHPLVKVNGPLLITQLDRWVPEFVVELNISDWEDNTIYHLTVMVENVNDPPRILFMGPASGSLYGPDEEVHFIADAHDEDEDRLRYTWSLDDEFLFSGMEYRTTTLPPGKHVVSLTVTDGQVTDQRSMVIVVKEGSDWLFTLAILGAVYMVSMELLVLDYIKSQRRAEREEEGMDG